MKINKQNRNQYCGNVYRRLPINIKYDDNSQNDDNSQISEAITRQEIQYKRHGQVQNYNQIANHKRLCNRHYQDKLVSIYQGSSHRGRPY